MQTLNDDTRRCAKPGIVAGQLISVRNIYLRQELRTISSQIQQKYQERLPLLNLVSLVAYEQVFNRQPLLSPEELRREAVKYGIKYYKMNVEKLRLAEARNGLCQPHDQLSCFDKKCSLHEPNSVVFKHNTLVGAQIDEDQATLLTSQHSIPLEDKNRRDHTRKPSLKSQTNDNTLDSTLTDAKSITIYNSSDESSTVATSEENLSSTSTFADTVSSSSTDLSSGTPSQSPSISSLSETTSNRSMITTKTDQLIPSNKKLSRTKSPKIIVHRSSDHSLRAIAADREKRVKTHRSPSPKRKSRQKQKRNRSKHDR